MKMCFALPKAPPTAPGQRCLQPGRLQSSPQGWVYGVLCPGVVGGLTNIDKTQEVGLFKVS